MPHLRAYLRSYSAFKYCCSARGEKLERTDIRYACLARVVRDGGFKIALIARYSAIPGHCALPWALTDFSTDLSRIVTTAVFSTCGMSVWTFSIAAILSLPKQLITVYLGVALEQSETGMSCEQFDSCQVWALIWLPQARARGIKLSRMLSWR